MALVRHACPFRRPLRFLSTDLMKTAAEPENPVVLHSISPSSYTTQGLKRFRVTEGVLCPEYLLHGSASAQSLNLRKRQSPLSRYVIRRRPNGLTSSPSVHSQSEVRMQTNRIMLEWLGRRSVSTTRLGDLPRGASRSKRTRPLTQSWPRG